jgi:hypothetical protein
LKKTVFLAKTVGKNPPTPTNYIKIRNQNSYRETGQPEGDHTPKLTQRKKKKTREKRKKRAKES